MRIKHALILTFVGMFAALGATQRAIAQVAGNNPPVVSVNGSMESPRRSSVQLYGWAYDPDGDSLSYRWQQVSGPAVTLSNAISPIASFTSPATPAVLTFVLRVSDGRLTSEATVEINVKNFAPVIS